ncbi:carbohydrate ABC transporter permease [Nonomuraea guangzhouensis]|uniref:Carbohydrate ABC transporter permease n=1 Tax=Nonomuraea guangzhouensis TaxID=1291555 RepID=A0ABW4GKB0_9ACTN|nr:sugar ABC transporter permease [Nonomuraea guangzhouensis]
MARTTSPGDAAGLGRARAAGFVLPALVLIGVFLVFPALWTIYLGLTDYRLTGLAAADPHVVGLGNYTRALSDPRFLSSLWLTVVYVGGSAILGQAGLGFTLAWLLRTRGGPLRRAVEGVVLLSWILPSTVVGFLWFALLDRDDGTLNALLGTPGFGWLLDYPLLSIVVFNVWRGTAFSMMLYAAALENVPPSHLETARLAGASVPQQLRDVVFPLIRRHVLTNLLLISLWTFNDFTPFVLTGGGPEGRSEILPVYVYDIALKGGELGLGAAVSFLILLINLVFALAYLRLLRGRRRAAGRPPA